MTDRLCEQTMTELAARLATGRLTSAALVEACLARIAEREPRCRAWVAVHADGARRQAAARDRERATGRVRGPLHGIPFGVKDLCDIAGWPTGFGVRAWAQEPARTTAAVVERLRAAGMIVLGQTQLAGFAFSSWGTNAVLGTPVNPADDRVARVPGGSSSGSAVAVADGMVPLALGSDTGGSIRIPASACGVVGFKTAVGALPMAGVAPLSPTLDTIGPLTRTVADALLCLAVMTGHMPDVPEPSVPDVAGVRIGLVDRDQWGAVDPSVADAVIDAAAQLARAGAIVSPIRLPRTCEEYQSLAGVIMSAEAYTGLGEVVRRSDDAVDPFVRARILAGAEVTPAALEETNRRRHADLAQRASLFGDHEVLLLPTTPLTARPIPEADETMVPMSRLTRVANWLDLAAISVPYGRDRDCLPIGVQLLALPSAGASIVAVARTLELGAGRLTSPAASAPSIRSSCPPAAEMGLGVGVPSGTGLDRIDCPIRSFSICER